MITLEGFRRSSVMNILNVFSCSDIRIGFETVKIQVKIPGLESLFSMLAT